MSVAILQYLIDIVSDNLSYRGFFLMSKYRMSIFIVLIHVNDEYNGSRYHLYTYDKTDVL